MLAVFLGAYFSSSATDPFDAPDQATRLVQGRSNNATSVAKVPNYGESAAILNVTTSRKQENISSTTSPTTSTKTLPGHWTLEEGTARNSISGDKELEGFMAASPNDM